MLAAANVINYATPCYNVERRFLTCFPKTMHALYELYNLIFTPGLSQLFWEAPEDCVTKAKNRFSNAPLPDIQEIENHAAPTHSYVLERTEHETSYDYLMRHADPKKENRIFVVPKPSKMAEYMWKIKPSCTRGPNFKDRLTGNLFKDLCKIQSYTHAAHHLTHMAVMQFSSEMCREILRVRHFLSSMAQKSGFSHKSPLPDVLFIYKLLLCL